MDTDENLMTDFKIERDTLERGYTKEDVIETISNRKKDSEHIRKIQIEKANVIIKLSKLNGLDIECNTDVDYMLFDFIKKMHRELEEFVWMNGVLGNRISITQSKGGNISSKVGDNLIIKESGGKLKDVKYGKGYSIINCKDIDFKNIPTDDDLDDMLIALVSNTPYKKSSMENSIRFAICKNSVTSKPRLPASICTTTGLDTPIIFANSSCDKLLFLRISASFFPICALVRGNCINQN
jgi:hypothetical protein